MENFAPKPSITIKGQKFVLVKQRRFFGTSVYKGKGCFLRIGEKEKVHREIQTQKALPRYGFPVPRIISTGKHQGSYYFIEASVGLSSLSDFFIADVEEYGEIQEKHFLRFLSLIEQFARAQYQSKKEISVESAFRHMILIDLLCEELPKEKKVLLKLYTTYQEIFQQYPSVLSHGDLNARNMHKKGIIDFEYADYVPFGYDLVTAIEHISFFPRGSKFEFVAKYHFTALQKKRYYQMVDSLCREYGLPELSKNKEAFIFCRLVWAAVRMQNNPRVQAWRYRLLKKKFL